MTLPIRDKAGVLHELNATLYLCESVLRVSESNGEPAEARVEGAKRADRLREAIRFIEDHADGAAS